MASELHAKARRAACWLPTAFEKLDAGLYADTWAVFQLEDEAKDLWGYLHCDLSDRMLIAFCEDRGWQDDHIGDANKMVEADGVEWEVKTLHMTTIGEWNAVAREEPDGTFTWGAWRDCDFEWDGKQGTAPTIEEAKRQAVEDARALGKEGE